MGKNKRWGRKYEDKRDWPAYNQQLINRGESKKFKLEESDDLLMTFFIGFR